jgi:arylsulfatase A-like enzyme
MNRVLYCVVLFLAALGVRAEPPNIVLIVVDDLGYADLSCTGLAKDARTPNIDKLAAAGVRFTDAYATAPICNASRVSIMTGCCQQRQGQYWYAGPGLHDPKFTTIAEVLKEQGYATGYVGKVHHSSSSDMPNQRGFPLNHGFDFFYGFAGGTKHYLHHGKKYGETLLHEGPMWVGREQKDVEGFSTELFGEQGREFIRRNKARPFYLHLSFNGVHNFAHQLPPEYLKENNIPVFDDMKPGEDYWEWRKKIGYPAHPEGRDYYLGQLYFLDREIGLLMKELEEQGLAENTAIIFVSDNGGSLVTYANNGPLKGGKYTLFEGGTRVPMIVSYPPQFKSAEVSEAIASTMDLFPSICALTGAPIPAHLDGLDLAPLLSGTSDSLKREYLFWDTQAEQAVRKGKWKLLITQKTPNEKLQITPTPKGTFLFNLETDPGETTNLIKQHPELTEDLRQALKKWQQTL